jgi:hypothetical protein
MSNFFYRRLEFFDKTGSPLNFDYIGPTGPTELDSRFTFFTGATASASGYSSVSQFDTDPGYIDFNYTDYNNFHIKSWVDEVNYFLLNGAEVFLNGRVAGQNQFSGKISSITDNTSFFTVNFFDGSIQGQRLISLDNQIFFTTSYKYRPGGYWKGNIYFDPVSSGLYENQQIFVVQNFDVVGTKYYGLPHTGVTGATAGKWRTRWFNDNYGNVDVSEIIFTYKIHEDLSGGDGYPLIISYPNVVHPIDVSPSDSLTSGGYVETLTLNSESLSINVALNATDLAADIYERKLIIEDISGGATNPIKVAEIDFYGEIIGEDERFQVMLQNIGRAFYPSDSVILRDHDPSEPLPNYIEINQKRKELLLSGEEIFPYAGSYKGLVNAIKFFGYQDLRIKEYWLNLKYQSSKLESPLQQNSQFLNQIKRQQSTGYSQSYQIGDVLDNPNSGKYKMVQTYGPDKNGNYVLNVSGEDTLLPSKTYKKTSLFGLYYDLNKPTGIEGDYGYPEVADAFQFTQEEVLIKLFALKERLKRDYLPLNARIVDITGEGIYFNVYNTKAWTDVMERPEFESGIYAEIRSNPDFGFLEDLRNFEIRPSSLGIQTPSNYYDTFSIEAAVAGGTGTAFFFSGIPATGPNPTLAVTAGKTYDFSFLTNGFDFFLTTDPSLNQVDPIGVENNCATSGGPNLIWYVNPLQTSPVYYYSSKNKTLLTGSIQILPAELSDLGNVTNPLSNQQIFTAAQNESLLTAISNFYELKQQGSIVELGDGKYDPPSFIDPTTGEPYKVPVGMPIILELITDVWTWDELNIDWSALLIPVFKIGDRVQQKSSGIFGTVTAVSYSTGVYTVLLDNSSSVTVDESDLFSSIQNYALLTWKNIDFSNLVEIEWIINKSATQEGSPYNFQFRGPVTDFYKLAHFVPYTGVYQVTCNVYDAFNAKTVIIKNQAIVVNPKTIDIDAWTRFREVEDYEWRNVIRSWSDYNSIWEYPAEGETINELTKVIPSEILDFASYGNKSEEGQDVFVKVNSDPIGATGFISFTQSQYTISEISSDLIIPGQYAFAKVYTSTPHNLVTGQEVTIFNTIPQIAGRWTITVEDGVTNEFIIPITIDPSWNNVYILTPPTRLAVDTSFFTNQYLTPSGSIKVYVGGRLIGSAEAGDNLYTTVNSIVSSVNSLRTYPDYFASCVVPNTDPVTLLIAAPDELGAQQNGIGLTYELTGSLSVVSASTGLTGGQNSGSNYVYWSESSEEYPNANLKYWGTKNLNWNVLTDNSWENAYAHTWFDFEYTNDWLGGYELHNLQPGDFVKVSTGNEFFPFPIGITIQPGVSSLTVQELADQLNAASDPNVTNFYYRPIPNESGPLPVNSPPINLEIQNTLVPVSSYAPAISQLGGSGILVANFTYYGGTVILPTTTNTTSTSTSTSTTSTTTSPPTSTTTTSTSTSTSTTSTSSTSTSTSTTSTSTSTTSTSTSTTTTLAGGSFTYNSIGVSNILTSYGFAQTSPFTATYLTGTNLSPGTVTFTPVFGNNGVILASSSATSPSTMLAFQKAPSSVTAVITTFPGGATYNGSITGSGNLRNVVWSGVNLVGITQMNVAITTTTLTTTTTTSTSTTTSSTTTTTTLAPGTGKLKNFGTIVMSTYSVNQTQPFSTTLASGSSLTPGGQATFSAYFASTTSLSVPITFNSAPSKVTGLLTAYPSGTIYTMTSSESGTTRTFGFSGNLSTSTSYQIQVSGVDFDLVDIGGGYTEIYNNYSSSVDVYDGNILIGSVGSFTSDYFGFSTSIKLVLVPSGQTFCFDITAPYNQKLVCP